MNRRGNLEQGKLRGQRGCDAATEAGRRTGTRTADVLRVAHAVSSYARPKGIAQAQAQVSLSLVTVEAKAVVNRCSLMSCYVIRVTFVSAGPPCHLSTVRLGSTRLLLSLSRRLYKRRHQTSHRTLRRDVIGLQACRSLTTAATPAFPPTNCRQPPRHRPRRLFDTSTRPKTPRRRKCNTRIELIKHNRYAQNRTQAMVQAPTVVAFKHQLLALARRLNRQTTRESRQPSTCAYC